MRFPLPRDLQLLVQAPHHRLPLAADAWIVMASMRTVTHCPACSALAWSDRIKRKQRKAIMIRGVIRVDTDFKMSEVCGEGTYVGTSKPPKLGDGDAI